MSTPPFSPPRSHSMRRAVFFCAVMSKTTLVTRVSNCTFTPCSCSQAISGFTRDSYWLYLVNFRAEKSGRPPMWWMKRCTYSFISRAECHSSKANMVRQYSQKVESKKSWPMTSLILLS